LPVFLLFLFVVVVVVVVVVALVDFRLAAAACCCCCCCCCWPSLFVSGSVPHYLFLLQFLSTALLHCGFGLSLIRLTMAVDWADVFINASVLMWPVIGFYVLVQSVRFLKRLRCSWGEPAMPLEPTMPHERAGSSSTVAAAKGRDLLAIIRRRPH
jgi:hypothetical protein